MRYETTITSKGTITIASPLRKALGLKPGQKVQLSLDKDMNRVVIETGMTMERFEAIRDSILSKYPDRPKGLSMKAMRDMAAASRLAEKK